MAENRSPVETGYPVEEQNPPQEPGMRPAEQPEPRRRVPGDWREGDEDPRESLAENPDQGTSLSQLDRELPPPGERAMDDPETPASEDMLR